MKRFSVAALGVALLFEGLVVATPAQAVTVYYQPTPYPANITTGIHIRDGWLSNSYNTTFVRDSKLQIGGWGDNYRTYLQFDLKGLPASVSGAYIGLHAYPRGDSSSLVNFDMYRLTSSWPLSMTWSTQPGTALIGSWAYGSNNSFWWLNTTSLYNSWRSGSIPNYGVTLMPWTQTNNFDVWRSSRYTVNDAQRPVLYLDFTPPVTVPNFKIPLPGNIRWLVTTEIGGWDCKGKYDEYHDNNNYFSIDFSWRGKNQSGTLVYPNPDPNKNKLNNGVYIPVIATAGGKVVQPLPTSGNGYNVVLDHDGDGNINTGFQTLYLHIQPPGPSVSVGQTVQQGDLLGYMGNTGISYGAHLHFGVRYQNNGSENANGRYVVMDGWILKSFQTECQGGDWIRYYSSSNRVY